MKSITIVILAALLHAVPCHADGQGNALSLTVGRALIAFPVPGGYVSTSEIPTLKEIAETATQSTHRLLFGLYRKEDVDPWRSGQQLKLNRYFLIETEKQSEDEVMSQAEFSRLKVALKHRIAARMVGNDTTARKQTMDDQREFDASLPTLRGHLALPPGKIQLGETVILGISDDQPASISTASATRLSTSIQGRTLDAVVVSVSTVLLCKGKLINIYGYSPYHGADDLRWLKDETQSFVAKISTANR